MNDKHPACLRVPDCPSIYNTRRLELVPSSGRGQMHEWFMHRKKKFFYFFLQPPPRALRAPLPGGGLRPRPPPPAAGGTPEKGVAPPARNFAQKSAKKVPK